jgi:hypothetical protein
MMTRREINTALSSGILIAASPGLRAQERALKELPPARVDGGKPLVEALRLRRSIREYSERSLPPQVLSDLLWAAYGVDGPSGDRTAPYWRHIMVIDVYAAMADGVWLYDPKRHALLPHLKTDIRPATGLLNKRLPNRRRVGWHSPLFAAGYLTVEKSCRLVAPYTFSHPPRPQRG